LTTKINTGRGLASGAELSAGYGFTRDRLRADYSYLDAKNEDTGEPLRLSPRHQWALTAEHRFAHAVAELKHTLWSSFFDRDATTNALRELPAWTTFDFTLRSRALKKWELEAGVANLFNVPRELTIGYPEPQRRLFISALSTF
jgi:outer membrane cobalamin receptor